MVDKKWFYERNDYLLDSYVNKTFEEVLWMDDSQFKEWCADIRREVVYSWDILGIPPRVGYNGVDIINQFQQMESFQVNKFRTKNELTGDYDVIRNTHILGNAINQFFPTMMKTPINYTDDVEAGKSIYDFFAKDELLDTFCTYARRHFKRDSFYHYSNPVKEMDLRLDIPVSLNGIDWILQFEKNYRNREQFDYWLCPSDDDKEYTGYNEELKNKKYLTVNDADILTLGLNIPLKCQTNICYKNTNNYQIRVFELGQKLFPIGLKAWRVSFCQYAVNYPPLTAKFLYETYTDEFKHEDNIIVWDPSSGWGGRLLGALSVKDDRHITYLGNDPNTEHNTTPGRTKYHEIYDFYCKNVNKGGMWEIPHNEFKFWQLGSEMIQYNPEFRSYKGMVSLVFTSPPYFAKEAYSQDPEQSYKKFSNWDSWVEGFLEPTLTTAYNWLRPGGYLLWNVADVVFAGKTLQLEQESKDICEILGFQFQTKLKMSLAQMPGGNRIDTETGLPKTKNYWKTKDGMFMKYEPIFVFMKPRA